MQFEEKHSQESHSHDDNDKNKKSMQQIKNKDVKILNSDSLKSLRDKIELLTIFNQIEIFRIIYTSNVIFSENKNGVFINLTYVNPDVIEKISEYIVYVSKQESHLNEVEDKKTFLSNQYFTPFKN
jgi:dipeptidase